MVRLFSSNREALLTLWLPLVTGEQLETGMDKDCTSKDLLEQLAILVGLPMLELDCASKKNSIL